MIRISLSSVLVSDQERALRFYTDVLGFEKKTDIPMGEARWLTVVARDAPDGTELLLEPTAFEAAATYQKAIYEAGIPLTAFQVDDIAAECARLREKGVRFRSEPTDGDGATIAVVDDTCGNLIQLYQI